MLRVHEYLKQILPLVTFLFPRLTKHVAGRNTVDHFIFAWWNFRENRTWHYFAKWWISDQRLSRIYDSLVKPDVWFSLILCLFILSRKKVYILWYIPVIHIHVLVSAYIRHCYEIALILNLYGSPKRDIIITRAEKCSRHTVNTPPLIVQAYKY